MLSKPNKKALKVVKFLLSGPGGNSRQWPKIKFQTTAKNSKISCREWLLLHSEPVCCRNQLGEGKTNEKPTKKEQRISRVMSAAREPLDLALD